MPEIRYEAEPTAARFHASRAFVRGLLGPIGSGKSVTCAADLVGLACEQKAVNGVRRSRAAVIRGTYPELKSTTIKTWMEWFGALTTIKWDAPITATFRMPMPDGTRVELQILFMAVNRPDHIKKLKSLDLTFVWLNEVSELAKAIFDMACGRVWRYPSMKDGGPSWSCVIMDTNPPDSDHWYYKLAEERDEAQIQAIEAMLKEVCEVSFPLFAFFKQPPALLKDGKRYVPNPQAENVRNHALGHGYWLNQIAGKTEEWIKVFLLGEYGMVQDGKPMYPEYVDSVHCAAVDILPIAGIPLRLGFDFGRTPACSISQLTPRGAWNVLDEIIGVDIGIRAFARDVIKPMLKTRYRGFDIISACDPGGQGGNEIIETTALRELNDQGIVTEAAWTNELSARHLGLSAFMLRMVDGKPAFQLSPRCKTMRKGFQGGYQCERLAIAGEERFRDYPVKNQYSHIIEALEYSAMEVDREFTRIVRTQKRRPRKPIGSIADPSAGY